MILTVTLNAAVDVTYRVPRIELHASHRVTSVSQIAGGKGINVASVLALCGVPVLATGLLGGATGEQIGADLDARGIAHDFARCGGESRRSVTVVSEADADATVFNEPGPEVSALEWGRFLDHLGGLLHGLASPVVAACGSLPPGVPPDAYAQVTRVARRHGAQVVVDSSGAALLEALAAGPDLVKPNREELREATGAGDPVTGARALQGRGARAVLVSAGGEGLVLVGPGVEVSRARLAEPLAGNPTGAGDAVVAAMAAALDSGRPAAAGLAEAVAWSAAAVLNPLAGHVRRLDIERLLPDVRVEQVAPPTAQEAADAHPTP